MYRIIMKDLKGKQYFYPEIFRTKSEADSVFEILQESDECVIEVVEVH